MEHMVEFKDPHLEAHLEPLDDLTVTDFTLADGRHFKLAVYSGRNTGWTFRHGFISDDKRYLIPTIRDEKSCLTKPVHGIYELFITHHNAGAWSGGNYTFIKWA